MGLFVGKIPKQIEVEKKIAQSLPFTVSVYDYIANHGDRVHICDRSGDDNVIIYTVPTGKLLYLYFISLGITNANPAADCAAILSVDSGTYDVGALMNVKARETNGYGTNFIAYPYPFKLKAGQNLHMGVAFGAQYQYVVVGYLMPETFDVLY